MKFSNYRGDQPQFRPEATSENSDYNKDANDQQEEQILRRNLNHAIEIESRGIKPHSNLHQGNRRKRHSGKHKSNIIKSNMSIILVLLLCFFVLGYVIFKIYTNEKEILGAKIMVSLSYLIIVESIIFALFLKRKYLQFQKTVLALMIVSSFVLTFLAFRYFNILQSNTFFIILIVTSTFSILTSHVKRDKLFAYLGLAGIPVVPFLITGNTPLFGQYYSYLIFASTMLYVLSINKKWKYVIYITAAVSWFISFIWMIDFYLQDISFIIILPYLCILFFTFHITYILFRFTQHKKSEHIDNLALVINFIFFISTSYFILYLDSGQNFIKVFTLINLGFHILISIILYLTKRKHLNLIRLTKIFSFVFLLLTIILCFPLFISAPLIAIPAIITFFYGRTKKIRFYMTLSYFLMIVSVSCIIYFIIM